MIGPQLFQSRYAHNGYKVPFAICAGAIGLSWAATVWTWWLTRNVEYDVKRIRKLRIQAERTGQIYAEDDIKVFEARTFYGTGLIKKKAAVGGKVGHV